MVTDASGGPLTNDDLLIGLAAEGGVGVWLLVPTSVIGDRISLTLADRYATHHTRIEVVEGPPSEVMPRIRQRVGGAPLGFVAQDEVAALDALSQGADEVMVWPPADDRVIHGFFDRTALRAELRKGRERSRASLVHAEKLSALGTLVASVAHEINNPLMALQLSIEACMPLMTARAGGQQLLEEMRSASFAIGSVVRDLRVFTRADGDREEAQLLDPNEVIDQALRLVGRDISMAARIERDYAPSLPRVVVPHGRLTQVLVNILINATHAIDDVQREAHFVRIATRADTEYVAISIADSGLGIASEALSHIFDPFFTTKRSGLGTGLGLSISRTIMRDLGGDLIVESVHGSGATFIALLPLPDRVTLRKAYLRDRNPMVRRPLHRRHTVLVVDDDERVLKAYARMLAGSCEVISARDGQEAIDLLSSGSSPDAVVTELGLPGVDGKALFEWLRLERPALAARTVFVTSDATRDRQRAFLEHALNQVLTKPIGGDELWAALVNLLNRRPSSSPPPGE